MRLSVSVTIFAIILPSIAAPPASTYAVESATESDLVSPTIHHHHLYQTYPTQILSKRSRLSRQQAAQNLDEAARKLAANGSPEQIINGQAAEPHRLYQEARGVALNVGVTGDDTKLAGVDPPSALEIMAKGAKGLEGFLKSSKA